MEARSLPGAGLLFLIPLAIRPRHLAFFLCLLSCAAGAACGAAPSKDARQPAATGDWFTDARGGERAPLHARQRHVGQASLRRRSWRRAWRCSTTTTTATSTSIVAAGTDAGAARRSPGAFPAAEPQPLQAGCSATISRSTRTARARCSSPTSPSASGIAATGYGMGVATGDFNNDGCVDLYLTNLGAEPAAPQQRRRHVHRRDEGERHATTRAWSVSAAFFDYDRDGWLDLFVGNYLDYTVDGEHAVLQPVRARRDYCPPNAYQRPAEPAVPQQPRRHVHRRDGEASGIAREFGPALGVVDRGLQRRRLDRSLRRQRQPAQPAVDQPARRHVQEHGAARRRGAERHEGRPKASMGVDAGDFDNDGDEDLFVTELTGQGTTCTSTTGRERSRIRARDPGSAAASLGVHGLRHRLVRLRQRRLARSARRERRGADHRGARAAPTIRFRCTSGSSCSAISATAASRMRPSRAGAVFQLVRGRPRRGVRRHRQRRRHRHRRRRTTTAPCGCCSTTSATATTGSGCGWSDETGATCSARASASSRDDGPTLWRRARADGSYASANDPRVLVGLGRFGARGRDSGASGRMVRPRSGTTSRSTGTSRSGKARASESRRASRARPSCCPPRVRRHPRLQRRQHPRRL